jgi:hypothetical protein
LAGVEHRNADTARWTSTRRAILKLGAGGLAETTQIRVRSSQHQLHARRIR